MGWSAGSAEFLNADGGANANYKGEPMTSQDSEQEPAAQGASEGEAPQEPASRKPLIDALKDDYLKYRSILDNAGPALIKQGKEMTGLLTLTHAANKICEIRDSLGTLYHLILQNLHVLKKYESERLNHLGHEPLPTWEHLKETETDMEDYQTYGMAIERFKSEELFKEHWYLPDIVITELEYMLDVMQILVEPDFVPFDSLDVACESTEREEGARHIPAAVKLAVWRRDMGKCCTCGSRERLEYDHIIPVSKGGSNTERNVQLLCEKCNREKSARIA